MAIQAINSATPVNTVNKMNMRSARNSAVSVPMTKAEIDEKQNDNLLLNLDYVGQQVKALLDLTAGKKVNVQKYSNNLEEDATKTKAQKQKDDAIVQLGYIGDCLSKLVEVKAGKMEEEKPRKQHG